MKKHLNWDENQNNGIIFNDKYTDGALFVGANLKPGLGIEYDSFQYGNVFDSKLNHITVNGVKSPFPQNLVSKVNSLIDLWIQPSEQEHGIEWTKKRNEFLAIKEEVNKLCKSALSNAGYSQEQIKLFFR